MIPDKIKLFFFVWTHICKEAEINAKYAAQYSSRNSKYQQYKWLFVRYTWGKQGAGNDYASYFGIDKCFNESID